MTRTDEGKVAPVIHQQVQYSSATVTAPNVRTTSGNGPIRRLRRWCCNHRYRFQHASGSRVRELIIINHGKFFFPPSGPESVSSTCNCIGSAVKLPAMLSRSMPVASRSPANIVLPAIPPRKCCPRTLQNYFHHHPHPRLNVFLHRAISEPYAAQMPENASLS